MNNERIIACAITMMVLGLNVVFTPVSSAATATGTPRTIGISKTNTTAGANLFDDATLFTTPTLAVGDKGTFVLEYPSALTTNSVTYRVEITNDATNAPIPDTALQRAQWSIKPRDLTEQPAHTFQTSGGVATIPTTTGIADGDSLQLYLVFATAGSYTITVTAIDSVTGETLSTCDNSVLVGNKNTTITVVDASGNPVNSPVSVNVQGPAENLSFNISANTGNSQPTEFLPPGTYQVNDISESDDSMIMLNPPVSFTVGTSSTANVKVVQPPLGRISGTATRDGATPFSSTVMLYPANSAGQPIYSDPLTAVDTDDQGKFSTLIPVGRYVITEMATGNESYPVNQLITVSSSTPLNLVLQPASSSGADLQLKPNERALVFNGETTVVPAIIKGGTTYMPVWYVMKALESVGMASQWDGYSWRLAVKGSNVNLGNIHPGSGKMKIYLNGTLVQNVSGMYITDSNTNITTTYMPVWYVMQALERAQIHSDWDGTHWTLTYAG